MAVYSYARVSTTKQATEGESLDVQQRTMAGYAMMHGLTIDLTFVERGVSGTKPLCERPEGSAMLAALKPGDAIVAAKLDRMFRSALDALDMVSKLKARGIGVHLADLGGDVTNNGISKFFFTIVAAFAEAERDRIAERVATVKADQRERGRFLGGSMPFGYQANDDGQLVEVPEQQATINEMRAMRDAGLSLRKIATTIQAQGYRLSHEAVRSVLNRQ